MATTPKAGDFDSVVAWLEERLADGADHDIHELRDEAMAFGVAGLVVARALTHLETKGVAWNKHVLRNGQSTRLWKRAP